MTKAEKAQIIEELKDKFSNANYFYIADASTLTVEAVNKLRRTCFEKDVEFRVAKNTLVQKALEQVEAKEYSDDLINVLKGPTSIFFSEVSNLPARVIKDFRKETKGEKPAIKAAYIDSDVFLGDEQLEVLSNLKSKNELIGDVIVLLQSPAKNVISGLTSSGNKLAAILKTLSERESA